MKFGFQFLSVVLLNCLLCLCGCREKGNGAKMGGQSAFAVYSHSPGAAYTITINNEPVGWAAGTDDYLIQGYPIHEGTNQIIVNAVFRPEWVTRMPRYYTETVSMRLCSQETLEAHLSSTNWDLIDEFNEIWSTNEPFVYTNDFEVKNEVINKAFEELGQNTDFYIDQCRSMAVKLASLIQKQDYDALAKVFGLTNMDLSKGSSFPINIVADGKTSMIAKCPELCPRLVYPKYELTNNDVAVTGVTEASEINAKSGSHLILLYCKYDKHFASFTNLELTRQSSNLKSSPFHHYGTVNIDSFVFGRVRGKWVFSANGCAWMNLNQEKLNELGNPANSASSVIGK